MTEWLVQPEGEFTRRELLGGSLLLGLAATGCGSLPAADREAVTATLPDFDDATVNLRNLVRMQGSTAERDVPWWFSGVIFGVRGESETPRPLVRFEGMEIYWFKHVPDGYQLNGHTVTFFRDVATNEYLHDFANPYTGRTDVVKPAVQGGNLGFRYTTRGIWPERLTGEALGEVPNKALRLQWHTLGDHVWLQHQTVYPPGMPPMHGQRQSMFASRRDFVNPSVETLPAAFASTVFMGWLKWMDMRGEPGHVIWHASGVKLESIAQLPAEYRERAEREYPERLSAKPRT